MEIYKIVNVCGPNALASEGPDWRRQRKIISPGFTERNNAKVWELGLKQAQSMLEYWASKDGNSMEEMKVRNTARDTATLTLHIICGAGFEVPQIWPHEDESLLGDKKMAGLNTKRPAAGRELTLKEALTLTTSIQIIWYAVLPGWVISMWSSILIFSLPNQCTGNSPFKVHQRLLAAREDCIFYLKELVEQKRNYRRMGHEQDATDLISKASTS